MASGYSQTMHFWVVNQKFDPTSNPCRGGIMNRGTEFEGEPTVDTEDWEGHSGSKSLKLASDRTKASAEPQWEQAFMFGEGVEDYFYLLLGSTSKKDSDQKPTYDSTEKIISTGSSTADLDIYKWKIYSDLENPISLPVATIINGYSQKNDAVTYDNAKMSELELAIDDNGVNFTVTFGSDAPIINQANPVKLVGNDLSRLGVNGVDVYIADFGTNLDTKTATELETYHYGCIVSSTNTFKTNLEDSICLGTEFGTANKDEGEFENDGEMEIRWSPEASVLIDKWYAGETEGTFITHDNCFQEILITGKSRKLGTTTAGVEVYETFSMYLPKVQIDKAWSKQSGDETKTIEMEYSLVSNGTVSPVKIDVTSKTSSLHWGTPQATKSVRDA